MKKFFISTVVLLGTLSLTSCLTPMAGTDQTATATTNTQTTATTQDPLNAILGNVMSSVDSQNSGLGSVLGNILSSVTGSATTTQANLIGTWTYTEPAVQFESEGLLGQAGGATAATQVESKLVNVYKKVGITQGKLVFQFDKNGQVAFALGKRTLQGTYTFDASAKTVTITTSTGLCLKGYVTISGNQMSLCFDSSKLLSFVSAFAGTSGTLGTLGTLAQSFKGMKTGFKFTR